MRSFNYDFPAASVLTDAVVRGYRRERSAAVVGGDFAEQRRALMAWAVQRRSGIRVGGRDNLDAVTARAGLAVQLRIPVLRLHGFEGSIVAPAQVVAVVDEPDLAGFAYGTLRGHPERGEESFLLHRADDGVVTLELRTLSRPAMPYALAAPLGRRFQQTFTARYLRALSTPA